MPTVRDEPLERQCLDLFEAIVREHSDGEGTLEALATRVIADLGAVAGIENVTTTLLDVDASTIDFVVAVRVGPRTWIPTLTARLTNYPHRAAWARS